MALTTDTPKSSLAQNMSVGLFIQTFPIRKVKAILVRLGKETKRQREFPNHLVVYFAIALSMMMSSGYLGVMQWLLEGVRTRRGNQPKLKMLCKSGISQARERLGPEPFKAILNEMVSPLAIDATKGAWYRAWRLVAVDGCCLDVEDTKDNASTFGRAKGRAGLSAYPKLRFGALVEIGTRVIFAANCGSYTKTSEKVVVKELLKSLQPGMLCLADRYYPGYDFIKATKETGADILWRVKSTFKLAAQEALPDGSYLTTIYPSRGQKNADGITVRVVEYKLKGHKESYRLITTILDHEEAPAIELAELYHERWEIEIALSEVKSTIMGNHLILRSKTPQLVIQEFYALILAHYVMRSLIHETAIEQREDPDRFSFKLAVEVVRRKIQVFGTFPPAEVA